MCFSAQASFIAGTGLTGFGIYLLNSLKDKKMLFFKAIPLLFGIQQLCEGVVWITQLNPDLALHNMLARYAFLFFAFFLWPLYIPYSLLQIEVDQGNKRCLSALFGAGASVATTLAWVSVTVGVASTISCNHIEYILDIPSVIALPGTVWYCVATIAPFFVVKKRYMQQFGLILLASALVSAYAYQAWFTSVWCFFAALLSVLVYKID